MKPNHKHPYDAEFDQLLDQDWPEITEIAVRRATTRVVWDRRIGEVNRFLAAAVLLMAMQINWGVLTLLEICQRPTSGAVAVQTQIENSSREY